MASDCIHYKQWIQDNFSKVLAEYERWLNRHSAEYERVKRSLTELCGEVDDLESAINSLNQHYLQNAGKGDKVPLSIIEGSKRLVARCEERINRLIVRINEELASFHNAGQTRVENMEWWIPRAAIVCVGGLLVLAVSFAITRKLAQVYNHS